MDIELARPELASLDTAIGAIGLGIASIGAYRVFTEVGTPAGTGGWLMVAVGWIVFFPRLFLKLRLGAEAVEVAVVTGTRTVPYDDITGARVVDGRLLFRLFGVGASGYHTGLIHLSGEGRVTAYASRMKGPFVLLERAEERPVVVSPADPDAFLSALAERADAITTHT